MSYFNEFVKKYLNEESLKKIFDNLKLEDFVYTGDRTEYGTVLTQDEYFHTDIYDNDALIDLMSRSFEDFKDSAICEYLKNNFDENIFMAFEYFTEKYYYGNVKNLQRNENFTLVGSINSASACNRFFSIYFDKTDQKYKNAWGIEFQPYFLNSWALVLNSPWSDETRHYTIEKSGNRYLCSYHVEGYEELAANIIDYGVDEEGALKNCKLAFKKVQEIYNKENISF